MFCGILCLHALTQVIDTVLNCNILSACGKCFIQRIYFLYFMEIATRVMQLLGQMQHMHTCTCCMHARPCALHACMHTPQHTQHTCSHARGCIRACTAPHRTAPHYTTLLTLKHDNVTIMQVAIHYAKYIQGTKQEAITYLNSPNKH